MVIWIKLGAEDMVRSSQNLDIIVGLISTIFVIMLLSCIILVLCFYISSFLRFVISIEHFLCLHFLSLLNMSVYFVFTCFSVIALEFAICNYK